MTIIREADLNMTEERDDSFWNGIARKYAEKPVPDEAVYEKKLKITQQYLKPEMNVLEIGCGTGSTALRHSEFVNKIKATDFSSEMIAIAKEKQMQLGASNIDFICEDLDESLRELVHYDVVMAQSVLHLVEQPFEHLKTIHDRLSSGGLLITSTVCMDGPLKLLKYVWPLAVSLGKVPRVEFFGVDALINAHRNVGFEIDYKWEPSKRNVFIIARKP